jgi:hypothetical protein
MSNPNPNPDPGAGGAPPVVPGGPADPKKVDTVDHATYQRTMDQLKEAQRKEKEANDRLAQIESDKAKAEQEKLVADGKLKEALELKQKELDEANAKIKTNEERATNSVKLNAFLNGLGGKLKSKEYGVHIELDNVKLDDKGNVDEASLKAEVTRFTNSYRDLIDFGTPAPPPPPGPGAPPGPATTNPISYANWLLIKDVKEKKMRWKDVIDKT